MKRVGVCIIGLNGAVASTVVAGVALMKKGLAPRLGMITEGKLAQLLSLAPIDDLVFGGWDIKDGSIYEAAVHHGVLRADQLEPVKEELSAIKPWPAVASNSFLAHMTGKHLVGAASYRDELRILGTNIDEFKKNNNLARVVMVNLTSTEKYTEVGDVHRTIDAFEAGLDASDARISPAMKYLYLSIEKGIPHANFTPSLSKIPALEALAEKKGVPIAGEDGKTGQTMLKTVLAPAFDIRKLKVAGWYSTNILGNNDGAVLNDPGSNKTKVVSKRAVLSSILGYEVEDHQVHIHYYRPRGDDKEAWDNIDLEGFLGARMQMKVNFLCKDSILAAPIVIDLVRLLDVAKKHGERGIQRQMSVFFKAPYVTEGEQATHDLFKQHAMLMKWAEGIAARSHESPSTSSARTPDTRASMKGNGNGYSVGK